eukprot:CAMPEP_0172212188 /NCGR_PEP_ID=MMETSP1050-20130122/36851_1 /TAXON_ID=233186 /ORGANISM="Cryptomonas curvata, Strain CCAP979/52" /LENGTH=98 /DNA_ID=CAMNT_0012892787 /DNA_START=190 /DNA_END=482 /DNA_ORIENTATION=+
MTPRQMTTPSNESHSGARNDRDLPDNSSQRYQDPVQLPKLAAYALGAWSDCSREGTPPCHFLPGHEQQYLETAPPAFAMAQGYPAAEAPPSKGGRAAG